MMLLGRERELAALAASTARLVTLWGPGGAGKTTLARAEADRVRAHGASCIWVDLASARSEGDVVVAFGATLGIEVANESAVLRVAEVKGGLVIADNVEQVGPDGRALLVRLAERARLLVTSRDALDAPGEHAIEVRPLAEEDAIALYTRLTNSVADDAVRTIVQRLDALPLAIELAAARAPLLGNTELLARLDRKLDVLKDTSKDPRHTTLRATIAWSWDLLADAERAALVACAQFAAPFDAALAEVAIGGDDALDHLESLRKRALVRVDAEHRLSLLESVRDFAREHLALATPARWAEAILTRVEPLALGARRGEAIAPELTLRRADLHCIAGMADANVELPLRMRAYIALASLRAVTGAPEVLSPPRDAGLALLEDVTGARASDLAAFVVREAAAAARAEGRLDEAESLTKALLGFAERESSGAEDGGTSSEPSRRRAGWSLFGPRDVGDALRLAGAVARSRGEIARALTLLERALATYRAAGEDAFAGITLGEIGVASQSDERLAEGIALLVATKSIRAEGLFRSHLAVLTHRRGDPRAAIPLHRAALAIHRQVGNRRLEGAELLHLGFVHHEIGETAEARSSFDEAKRPLALAGARGLESFANVLIARLLVDLGDLVEARIALAEAARIAPAGWPRLEATRLLVGGHLAFAHGDRAAAVHAYDASLAASRDVEVGFEALTPAYRALAAGTDPEPAPPFKNPHLAVADALLRGLATAAPPEAVAASSEVRRALSFTAAKRSLVVTADGVLLPDGRTIDLARRKNLRFIVHALAQAQGAPSSAQALIEAGWPGERMRAEAATKRLHTAVWTLRKLGLEGILLSSDEGYWLNPALAVVFERL